MIQITKLLKDSFKTYKINFKNLAKMGSALFVLTAVAEYVSERVGVMANTADYTTTSLAIGMIVYILLTLIVSLFFAPAMNRSVQKNEDNGRFDLKEGYSFQKKNMWKFVMVNLWGIAYAIVQTLPYLIIAALLTIIMFMTNGYVSEGAAILFGITLFIALIRNITKFVLYKNIFFSKTDTSAQDAVKESIALGATKNREIWKLIVAILIFVLIIFVVSAIIGYFLLSLTAKAPFNINGIIIGPLLNSFLWTPLLMVILSKGYTTVVRG